MKEAIQKYKEELYKELKYIHIQEQKRKLSLEEQIEVRVLLKVASYLHTLLVRDNEKPLIKNSLIDTEENKSENWRLTKYP